MNQCNVFSLPVSAIYKIISRRQMTDNTEVGGVTMHSTQKVSLPQTSAVSERKSNCCWICDVHIFQYFIESMCTSNWTKLSTATYCKMVSLSELLHPIYTAIDVFVPHFFAFVFISYFMFSFIRVFLHVIKIEPILWIYLPKAVLINLE